MGPMDDPKGELVNQLVEAIRDISGVPECRNASRKMYSNLVRRVKLLSPLFEELKDSDQQQLGEDEVEALQSLKLALNFTMDLLRSVNQGSKIFQVYILLVFCVFLLLIMFELCVQISLLYGCLS